jgi:hypothetical protein
MLILLWYWRRLSNPNTAAHQLLDCTPRSEICLSALYNSSTPICRNGRFRSHRSRYRRSIARKVLSANSIRRATCRADAPSHAYPTASSKRLLKGDLLGNSGTPRLSRRMPGISPDTPRCAPVVMCTGGAELAPQQVPHRPLSAIVGVRELAAAAETLQLPVAALRRTHRSCHGE